MQLKIRSRRSDANAYKIHKVNGSNDVIQEQHHHFVRLHPKAAAALLNEAREKSSGNISDNDAWNVPASLENDTVEFLPLALTFLPNGEDRNDKDTSTTIYASYNGGTCLEGKYNNHTCHIIFSVIYLFLHGMACGALGFLAQ